MNKRLAVSVCAVTLSLVATVGADARGWLGGGWARGGSYSSSRTATWSRGGNTYSHTDSTSAANGSVTHTSTTTGPAGNSVTHTGTTSWDVE